MRVPLSDPIWDRLYGPYGVDHVNLALQKLLASWDDAQALDLFWTKLYHQQTLYPVTYAALPWIVEISKGCAPKIEALLFLSETLSCALAHPDCSSGTVRYQGLSTQVEDHRHNWLTGSFLTQKDMDVLTALEGWFTEHLSSIAQMCRNAVVGTDDNTAAHLLVGYCSVHNCHGAAYVLELWAEDLDPDDLKDIITSKDHVILRTLAAELSATHPGLTNTILRLLGIDLPDPRQSSFDF